MKDKELCPNCGRPQPEHAEVSATNVMKRNYAALSEAARAGDFLNLNVRLSYIPPRSYIHTKGKCGGFVTTIGFIYDDKVSYDGEDVVVFCDDCKAHFPQNEFNWHPDGVPMDPDLREVWKATHHDALVADYRDWLDRELTALKSEQSPQGVT